LRIRRFNHGAISFHVLWVLFRESFGPNGRPVGAPVEPFELLGREHFEVRFAVRANDFDHDGAVGERAVEAADFPRKLPAPGM
jgi:hypothetical protein